MKVIKLNRRYKVFKEHGHEVAVKFNSFSKASPLERVCQSRMGGSAVWNINGTWYGWFGKKRPGYHNAPYFISFRKESDLTFALMCLTSN